MFGRTLNCTRKTRPRFTSKNNSSTTSIPAHLVRRDKRASSPQQGEGDMRVVVFVKATEDSEAGVAPSSGLAEAMGKYNEELIKAGVMIGGDGLKPSSHGARVAFDGPRRTVTDGPFAEARELVAGFWIWEVKDMEEAKDWVRRCPNPMPGPSVIEIRPVIAIEDFGDAITPEVQAIHDRNRDMLEGR